MSDGAGNRKRIVVLGTLAVADAYFDSDRILARFIDQGRHAWLTAR